MLDNNRPATSKYDRITTELLPNQIPPNPDEPIQDNPKNILEQNARLSRGPYQPKLNWRKFLSTLWVKPVSYTHLDVYKRQCSAFIKGELWAG